MPLVEIQWAVGVGVGLAVRLRVVLAVAHKRAREASHGTHRRMG
jgi:hypothetical protein